MKSIHVYLSIIILTLSGCSSQQHTPSITPLQAPDVRIVTGEPDPRVCLYVGEAEGYGNARNLADSQAQARLMIKNQAASMGGNIVRLDTNTFDEPGEVVLNGRIFKCDMSMNPEDILGPIKRTSPGSADGPDGGPQTGANGQAQSGSQTTARATTNPPLEPAPAFDEKTFLQAGEGEFEG